jgi:hypothetical protein
VHKMCSFSSRDDLSTVVFYFYQSSANIYWALATCHAPSLTLEIPRGSKTSDTPPPLRWYRTPRNVKSSGSQLLPKASSALTKSQVSLPQLPSSLEVAHCVTLSFKHIAARAVALELRALLPFQEGQSIHL